jgi:tetratricopeptide (TPR) repeat protein
MSFCSASVSFSLVALLVSQTARADEQGGTESILNRSAGLRALGMGGVLVAIADDASALEWNPAGLARVGRGHIEAEETDRSLSGAQQFYVAAALPSWRFGTLAFSANHFSIGGIDARDAGGAPLGADLTSSEDQFVVGYARAFPALALGGSLTMERQQIGDVSGGGFGASLGLLVHPGTALRLPESLRDRVTVGLHVRNLLQPTIRLEQDPVSDPTAISAGLALTGDLPGLGAIVGGLDLEHVSGAGSKARAGLEVRPFDAVAMRTGLNAGHLTAGMDVTWRKTRILYSFEDQPLESVHRVGIVVPFGRTTSESRETARAADARRFQERLDAAFHEQQEARATALLRQVGEAEQSGDIDRALRLLEGDTDVLSSSSEACARYLSCLRIKAARQAVQGDWTGAAISYTQVLVQAPSDTGAARLLARCRAESERHAAETAATRQLLSDALDAFARERFAQTRTILGRILTASPGDSTAAALMRRTNEAIRLRVPSLVRQIGTALDLRRFDDADRLVGEAQSLDPSAAGLDALRARLAAARRAPPAGTAEPQIASADAPAKAPVSAEATREADALFHTGTEALARGRHDDAMEAWQRAWSINPRDARIATSLKRECMLRGMDAYAAGRLDEAARLWKLAVRVDPGDARANGYLAKALEQLDRLASMGGSTK